MASRPANRPGELSEPEVVTDDQIADVDRTGETELPPAEGTVVTPSPPEPMDGFTNQTTRPAGKPGLKAPAARRPAPRERPAAAHSTAELDQLEGDPAATRILASEAIQAPARFELLVTDGRSRGTRFPLRPGVHTVGRSSQCECSILDEAVSRRHFEVEVDKDGVLLRDLGSGNGTLVNGERAEELALSHGDRIQIGDTILELRERGKAPVAGRASPAGRPAARGRAGGPARAGDPAALRRKLVAAAVAAVAFLVLVAALGRMRARQQAVRVAMARFERGRQDLDQGDADAALDEFQQALQAYPDPSIVQEKIAIARVVGDGQKQLAKARDLADQHDFEGARKALDAVPHNDLLDAPIKDARADIDKREADAKAAAAARAQAGQPVDPTTLAEAKAYWTRGKGEARGNLEAALSDLARAYEELASRGAGGPDFEQIRSDYLELLRSAYQRYRRSNRARAALELERANAIQPGAISPDDLAGGPAAAPEPAVHHHKHHPPPRRTSHHSAPRTGGDASPSRRAGPGRAAGRYDEPKAEALCDEADALLGQDPDAARRKYQEALRLAPPGSDAARHAQQGLNP